MILDWSQATIPIGIKKVSLKPKNKGKYIVFPSEDPRSHILYNETNFANCLVFPKEDIIWLEELVEKGLWALEFDGRCTSVSFRVIFVLITPSGNIIPKDFKLYFENMNNIVEHEDSVLVIEEVERRGVKILRAKGDYELSVK